MKKEFPRFPLIFSCLMLALILCWMILIPLRSVLSFQQEDLALSLETSYGRERKQQHEYDQVTADLPVAREELAELQPQAEAAQQEVTELKAQRKELRAKLKALQEESENAAPEEEKP